jgi:hypothetical protein
MRKLAFIIALVLLFALALLICLAMPGVAQDTPAVPRSGAHLHASAVTTTLIFQQGVSPDASYAGAADTHIDIDHSIENFGGDDLLRVNHDGRQKVLLRFDLSNYIPTGAVVTAARLELYAHSRRYGRTINVGLYKVLRPWTEDATTWNEPWQEPGCEPPSDREAEYIAVATFRYTKAWQVWDNDPLKDLVQEWVHHPSSNYGVVLVGLPTGNPDWWTLYSSDYGNTAGETSKRPMLTVSYYVPPPTATPTATRTPTQVVTEGSVAGMAWRDQNRNRVRDPGEPPMPGVTIVLQDSGYVEVDRRRTLADGSYEFAALDPGNYVLTKVNPVGHDCTHPPGGVYIFSLAGERLTGFDFGFALPPTATPTPTQSPTPTNTSTPTRTPTRTATPTITPTGMPTWTPTRTPVFSPTPTSTSTQGVAPTPTATETPTGTVGPSPTPTGVPAGTLEDPIPVVCERAYSGDTTDYHDNIRDYGECFSGLQGPEVVYVLQVSYRMDYVSIQLDTQAALALFVLPSPNPNDCLDMGGSVLLPDVDPGTYYIVVDGFAAGAYRMEIRCYPPVQVTPTATRTPTASPTSGPSPTPTVSPTWGPSPTPTVSPTGGASPTPTVSPTSGPSPTPTSTRTPGGPSTIYLPIVYKPPLEFLVDCGAQNEYVDSTRRRWLADKPYAAGEWGYVGDSLTWSTSRDVSNTSDPRLYWTLRYAFGSFGYRFDVPNGRYEVELRFAEVYPQFDEVGERVFDVQIEGQTVLDNLDVVAEAPGQFRALIKTFTVELRDEQLNVTFVRDWVNGVENPIINALRVIKLD